MTAAAAPVLLTIGDRAALTRAVDQLENRGFAIKVASLIGQPVTTVVGLMPKAASRRIVGVLEGAIQRCLTVAIDSLDGTPPVAPLRTYPKILAGLTGGIGGLFGAFSLPVELPMTTILMLQSIADIARHQGEDLRQVEARLACLEVFALSDRSSSERSDIGYYATRTMLAQLTADVATLLGRRQAVDATSPVVARMVGEFAGRFGIAVSERAAASAVPIIGAVGGATVNVLFMSHFQQIAEGHFTIRRLERKYGDGGIRGLYGAIAHRPEARAP